MNKEQRIQQLKLELTELLKWKSDLIKQQISFPMGVITKQLITKDILMATGKTETGVVFDSSIDVTIDGRNYWISAKFNG